MRKEIKSFLFCFKIVLKILRKKWQIQNEAFKANCVVGLLSPPKTKIISMIYFVSISLQKIPPVANMIQKMNTHIYKLIFNLF